MCSRDVLRIQGLKFLADPIEEFGQRVRNFGNGSSWEQGPHIERAGAVLGLECLDVPEEIPSSIIDQEAVALGLQVSLPSF